MPVFLKWLTETDGGLFTRIAVGATIFLTLAIADLRKNHRHATRWREYLFLLASVGVALIYGIINDLITCRISPEYFLYGKGLDAVVGNRFPLSLARLPWEAAKVGMKATWTVGLIVGVALLFANNPSAHRRRLTYRELFAALPIVVGGSLIAALVLGIIGSLGGLAILSEDFREMIRRDEFRPYRFMTVYGIHLGGYLGGITGTVLAVLRIRRQRKLVSVPPFNPPATAPEPV
jgi:hypothetical protein